MTGWPGEKNKNVSNGMARKKLANMEPGLLTHELQGGAVYTEYRTDDARLTMSVLKSASGAGAVCLNYMLVKDFVRKTTGSAQCWPMIS